jgi:type IV secretory pathway protease TraF
MGYLHRVPILKQIAAGEGDVVCTRAGGLSINGRWRAPVFVHDPRGATLPQWRGCRALLKGEFFVFSSRIPNSFDSRYYGPVKVDQIMGVFEPVATTTSYHGDA